MASFTGTRKLTFASYNCQIANDAKLPHLRELFQNSDFLLLQEHGLYKNQFDWFNNVSDSIAKHGVSAMDVNKILGGR